MDPAKKIMIIDDEVDLCLLMQNYFLQRQFQVRYATTLLDGLKEMKTYIPEILFLDNNLPDGIGWDLAGDIIDKYPAVRIYLMSGYLPNLPEDIPSDRLVILQKPISFRDLDGFILNNSKGEPKA